MLIVRCWRGWFGHGMLPRGRLQAASCELDWQVRVHRG